METKIRRKALYPILETIFDSECDDFYVKYYSVDIDSLTEDEQDSDLAPSKEYVYDILIRHSELTDAAKWFDDVYKKELSNITETT